MFKHKMRRPRSTPSSTFDVPALCALYHWPKITVPRHGVVGIIELGGGYHKTDISAAFSKWGQPTPVITDVSVSGGSNSPGGDADGEVVSDIEVAGASYSYVAHQACLQKVYFAPNTDNGFVAAIDAAVHDKVDAISISWGGPENAWTRAAILAMHGAFSLARQAFIPVFVASGDNDAGDGESGYHTDYPASDPYVVGCGGTKKTSALESVWNDGQNGTGGGFSTVFARPSWQTGGPSGNRMVPDVAAVADPNTGYNIYLNGGWTVIGGTSLVAPMYAGLAAALKAAGVLTNQTFPDYLWASARNAFVDVTVGNNIVNGKGYSALVGPDACTGLGVVNGTSLRSLLAAHHA